MTPRTSQSHPLQIAEVRAKPEYGRIGITFCPGKKDSGAMTGGWDRDLGLDLDAIQLWGAVAVLTLIEDHEIKSLKVDGIGVGVMQRHMEWHHLPITDVSTPTDSFERAWAECGEGVRSILRAGFNIVVHCKGGLGRAGTIAAKLLVELGMPPAAAIAEVRRVRPGAIETAKQEAYVKGQAFVPERQPETSVEAIRDRAIGALLGLAVGDAVGTTLEFKSRDSYPLLTDMIGGGPFKLKPGEWTDDTAMALALADSLQACGDLDEQDLLRRFVDWHEHGTYSCTGKCFDIGITTSQALGRWKKTGEAHCGSTDPNTAGNGSLMRLAPVAIRFFGDRVKLRDVAARQSKTTHAAPEAVDACVAYAELLADAIQGKSKTELLKGVAGTLAGKIGPIINGSWRAKKRADIKASGYVAHSLEASLWSFARTGTFKSAVLTSANLGDDADTTGAICGQLAGTFFGIIGIPVEWRNRISSHKRIEQLAIANFQN